MRGMIRTLTLGAVLAAGTATAAMAQGVNDTGYSRDYYNGYPQHSTLYGDLNSGRYYGPGDRGYGGPYQPGWGSAYNRGYATGPVPPSWGDRYDYYGNSYGPGWGSGSYGYGGSYPPGLGSGGGAAYDREYGGYNRGYWGR